MMLAPDRVLRAKNQYFEGRILLEERSFYEAHDPCDSSALGASVVVDVRRLADCFRRIAAIAGGGSNWRY